MKIIPISLKSLHPGGDPKTTLVVSDQKKQTKRFTYIFGYLSTHNNSFCGTLYLFCFFFHVDISIIGQRCGYNWSAVGI